MVNNKDNGRSRINWFLVREVISLAKDIVSRYPEEECPIMWRALRESVNELNEQERLSAVFSLVIPVLSKDVRIESLFALTRATGNKKIAYATAAIAKAMRAERIEDPMRLAEFGLVEARMKDGRVFLHPFIGNSRLTTAASKMAAKGLERGARVLREHLDHAASYRRLKKAKRTGERAPAESVPLLN